VANGLLRVYSSDGSYRQIYAGPAYRPRFCGDGRTVVFDDRYDIWAINVDGSSLRKVVGWKDMQNSPACSADSAHIAFVSSVDARGRALPNYWEQIFTARLDGSNARQITSPSVTLGLEWATGPSFSPNGAQIVYSGYGPHNGVKQSHLYTQNFDGANMRRITGGTGSYLGARWSPDGRTIAFCNNRRFEQYGSYDEIYGISPDGTGERSLVLNPPNEIEDLCPVSYREVSTVYDGYDYAAVAHRPLLYFDSNERWRPVNVDSLLNERELDGTERHAICRDTASESEECLSTDTGVNSLRRAPGSEWFLSIRHEARAEPEAGYAAYDLTCNQPGSPGVQTELLDCDHGVTSNVYYRISPTSAGGYRYLDYWWFYRYNHALDGFSSLNHEGDWEGVTVAPTRDAVGESFDFASFSQHGTWYSYLREHLECDAKDIGCGTEGAKRGRRLVVYPATGTHANYPKRCSSSCHQGGGFALPERSSDGAAEWGRNNADTTTALLRFPPALGWDAPSTANWTDWPGRWGRDEGPGSPGRNPHWTAPYGDPCAVGNDGCARSSATSTTTNASIWARSQLPSGARQASVGQHNMRQQEAVKYCASWFGTAVSLLVCEPKILERGLRRGDVRGAGGVAIATSAGSREGRGAGISQLYGAPLKPGARVRLGADGTTRGSVVFARVRAGGRTYLARFAAGRLKPGEKAEVRVSNRGTPLRVTLRHGKRGYVADELRRVND